MRLPPYHSDLNPIELIWAFLKKFVASHNTRFTLSNAQELFLEARLKAEESGLWKKCVDHVIKLEDDYWKKDGIMDDLDALIVNVRDDDDDDNDDEIDVGDETETMDLEYVEDDDDVDTKCEECKLRDPRDCDECVVEWVECGFCNRWFHKCCLGSNGDDVCKKCTLILRKSL